MNEPHKSAEEEIAQIRREWDESVYSTDTASEPNQTDGLTEAKAVKSQVCIHKAAYPVGVQGQRCLNCDASIVGITCDRCDGFGHSIVGCGLGISTNVRCMACGGTGAREWIAFDSEEVKP